MHGRPGSDLRHQLRGDAIVRGQVQVIGTSGGRQVHLQRQIRTEPVPDLLLCRRSAVEAVELDAFDFDSVGHWVEPVFPDLTPWPPSLGGKGELAAVPATAW